MATNTLFIKDATLQDAQAVLDIGRSTFIETFGPVNKKEDMDAYLAESFTLEKIKHELSDQYSKFFLAWLNIEIVGYIKFRSGNNPDQPVNTYSIELERIYIQHKYLGNKFGAELMEFSITYAQQSGYETIWLGVWENNMRARKFYERWGFTYYGSHQFVLGTDVQTDVLMKKSLA
jgi:diamine N-acetyltransferase